MKIDAKQPIGRFAAEIPGAIAVFEALGIDYACLCDCSLDDAAHAEGIAPDVVVTSLRRLKSVQEGDTWSDRSLSDLTRHLAPQHHHFVRHELGQLAMLLSHVCGQDDVPPDGLSLRAAFTSLAETLLPHFQREETKVFGPIEAMEKAWQSGEAVAVPADLTTWLRKLGDEHGLISAQLRTMRDLRIRLSDANDLPPRWSSILEGLATLEAHLRQYMFLENWILFPRAAMLAEQSREGPATRS